MVCCDVCRRQEVWVLGEACDLCRSGVAERQRAETSDARARELRTLERNRRRRSGGAWPKGVHRLALPSRIRARGPR